MRLTVRGKVVLAVISVLLVFFAIYFSINTGFATKDDEPVNYIFYTVKSTDTLWSIACEHTDENKDVRETLYEIKKLNSINETQLQAGMRLAIFK